MKLGACPECGVLLKGYEKREVFTASNNRGDTEYRTWEGERCTNPSCNFDHAWPKMNDSGDYDEFDA